MLVEYNQGTSIIVQPLIPHLRHQRSRDAIQEWQVNQGRDPPFVAVRDRNSPQAGHLGNGPTGQCVFLVSQVCYRLAHLVRLASYMTKRVVTGWRIVCCMTTLGGNPELNYPAFGPGPQTL